MTQDSSNDIFQLFRDSLQPQGDDPLVRLHINRGYFKREFVLRAIDYIEKKAMLCKAGIDSMTPADEILMHVLIDSSGLDSSYWAKPDSTEK